MKRLTFGLGLRTHNDKRPKIIYCEKLHASAALIERDFTQAFINGNGNEMLSIVNTTFPTKN